MISSGLQVEEPPRRNFQEFNALHSQDLMSVSLMPGRDHRFDFRRDGRGCADQPVRRLIEISNLHVGGCCFCHWRNRLEPGVFNLNWNAVRGGAGDAVKEQGKKPGHHVGRSYLQTIHCRELPPAPRRSCQCRCECECQCQCQWMNRRVADKLQAFSQLYYYFWSKCCFSRR